MSGFKYHAVFVLLLFVSGSANANLLVNSGFENGYSMPYYWNTWGDGDYLWQNSGAHSGSRCMNLGGSDFALMYQRVSGNADEGYTVKVWAKSASAGGMGEIKLEFHDSSQTKIVEYRQYIYPSTEWLEYSVAGVAPGGTTYVTATVVGLAGTTVSYDDVSLVEEIIEPELVVDVHSTTHEFWGLGAQTWDASADTLRVYNDLNIQYVRVSSTSAAVVAANMGINVMFLRWSVPSQWVDGDNELLTEYVDDYAVYWADTVGNLAAGGLVPPYIELSNEPDGNWNTYISPANYNTLVKLTRVELDARGLADVGIVGPSLANLDWDNHNSTWINALDAQGVASLAVWGSHTWDDHGSCGDGAGCINRQWPDFGDSADAQDSSLPKFISEFATKENVFHGVTYPHPDSYRDYNATNSMPYAARVYENGLALVNRGANVPFIWQATDQSWETKGWGLIDLSSNPKPVFYALQTLWPVVPVGSKVIDLGDQSDSLLYCGAFVDGDRLVIGLANDGSEERDKTIRVDGVLGVNIVQAVACLVDHQGDPAIEDPDTAQIVYRSLNVGSGNIIEVTLPADSTLTVVCDLQFPEGDLNFDGMADLSDFAVLADCLGGPEVSTPPGACTLEMFERADLDEDADVDLCDLSRFLSVFGG